MAHCTTLAVQRGPGLPHPADEAREPGHSLGQLRVAVDGQRLRVQTPRVSTQWLPDTPSNRHLTGVWLRLLVDAHGRPWFSLQA